MIFARSKRATFALGALSGFAGLALAGGSVVTLLTGGSFVLSVVLTSLAMLGLVVVLVSMIRLRARPANRLGFFRDRLVVVQGRNERHAAWDRVELATLAALESWRGRQWPELQITDELTLTLGEEVRLAFKPAVFGLAPVGCRDLIMELRDDPRSRERLPDFDSALDLVTRPVVTGELITPRL